METKPILSSREDVYQLVTEFYSVVRKDKILGPIFEKRINSEEEWNLHFEKLTDFWESNIFGVIKYKGNPMIAHQKTDKSANYGVTQNHFVRWLGIWNKTIDSLFEGEKAEYAKEKARRMSTHLYIDMWKHKPKPTE